jgi:hypothetical protein
LNILEVFEKEFRSYQTNSKFIFIETIETNAKEILNFFNDTDAYTDMSINEMNSTCIYEVSNRMLDPFDTEKDEEENEEAIEEVEERANQDYQIASTFNQPNSFYKRKLNRNSRERNQIEKILYDARKNLTEKTFASTVRSESNFSLAENLVSDSTPNKAARLDVGFVFSGKINYVKNPSCLWVQLNERNFADELEVWCSQVESLYDSSALSKICEGELASYHHQKLDIWVRVRVEKLFELVGDIRQRVCLISPIDYGGYFKVKLGELRKCLPRLLNIEPNCIKAYLHFLKPYTCNEEEGEEDDEVRETSKWSDECAFLIKAWVEFFDYSVKVSG